MQGIRAAVLYIKGIYPPLIPKSSILSPGAVLSLRVCEEITCALWRERRAGRCEAPRRRRCGDIVEELQRGRCPPAAAPLRAAARRPAGFVARSLHATRHGWAFRPSSRRSRLASGPGGLQQNVTFIHLQVLRGQNIVNESSEKLEAVLLRHISACLPKTLSAAFLRNSSLSFIIGLMS